MNALTDVLDLRGQLSPVPTLKVAQHCASRADGQFQILADDDAFPSALDLWCKTTGKGRLVEMIHEGSCWSATVEVVGGALQRSLISQSIDTTGQSSDALVQALDDLALQWKGQVLEVSVRGDCEDFAAVVEVWSASRSARMHSLMNQDGVFNCALQIGGSSALQSPPRSDKTPRNFRAINSIGGASSLELLPPNSAPSIPVRRSTPVPVLRTTGPHDRSALQLSSPPTHQTQRCALLLSHDDPSSAIAALHMAEEAAREELQTTVFFTGAAVKLLAKPSTPPKPSLLFFWRRKPAQLDRPDAIRSALESGFLAGVRFQACARTMKHMGLSAKDLMPRFEVQISKARVFVRDASDADVKASF